MRYIIDRTTVSQKNLVYYGGTRFINDAKAYIENKTAPNDPIQNFVLKLVEGRTLLSFDVDMNLLTGNDEEFRQIIIQLDKQLENINNGVIFSVENCRDSGIEFISSEFLGPCSDTIEIHNDVKSSTCDVKQGCFLFSTTQNLDKTNPKKIRNIKDIMTFKSPYFVYRLNVLLKSSGQIETYVHNVVDFSSVSMPNIQKIINIGREVFKNSHSDSFNVVYHHLHPIIRYLRHLRKVDDDNLNCFQSLINILIKKDIYNNSARFIFYNSKLGNQMFSLGETPNLDRILDSITELFLEGKTASRTDYKIFPLALKKRFKELFLPIYAEYKLAATKQNKDTADKLVHKILSEYD
jgi:hypothetical protein